MDSNIVHMEPTKALLIDLLIKDIKLDMAILELIDNSIDAANQTNEDISNYKIKLTLSKKNFIIEDNCGGISINDASNYVFKLGNDGKRVLRKYSIGHYNIGMKRAIFKIGNKIQVESATEQDYFSSIINVSEWKESTEWAINFDKTAVNDGSKQIGTMIRIQDLNWEAKKCFEEQTFIAELRKSISEIHEDTLIKGITIVVNNVVIKAPSNKKKNEIVRRSIDCKNYNIKIIIKSDVPDYNEAGWYVYLNDRMVVNADKTELTGWNVGDKEQYYGIRGEIHIRAEKEGVLPFNTTKEGLDTSNPIYSKMKKYMAEELEKAIKKTSNKDFIKIQYTKPRKEVEKLKKDLNVKYAKCVGEITYEEYVRTHYSDKL